MFKKPLELKTSAPVRSSDRRKLKQRIIEFFSLTPEVGDLLVPDGLLSLKIITHTREPGLCYLSSERDPLWFSLGKNSDDLVPTVYTLWKHPTLLPFLSTPDAVFPHLIGGADLMIPGVVQHSIPLSLNQLVSITKYHPPSNGKPQIGPPLAVGRMAVSNDQIVRDGKKGKAVLLIHVWKDHLFEMGAKGDPLPARDMVMSGVKEDSDDEEEEEPKQADDPPVEPGSAFSEEESEGLTLTPQEVSDLLRLSIVQSITTTLSILPQASFPITATTFYTSHLLPSRPIEPTTSASTPVDIKNSAHKNLAAFLRYCTKEGLIKTKEIKGDLVITGVNASHKDVQGHVAYRTIKDIESKKERKEGRQREEEERKRDKDRELQVTLLWKPNVGSSVWFRAAKKDPTAFYTQVEIRAMLNAYIVEKQLLNPQDQAYVNVTADQALLEGLSDGKSKEKEKLRNVEFMKRDEVLKQLVERMQAWYEIQAEGKDTILKKGHLGPISIVVKTRQGKRASTLITGFEPFFLSADDLAEDLRKACACSTSVHPITGKTSGKEVLVQGKHIDIVTDLLASKGLPKKWVEASDLTGKK